MPSPSPQPARTDALPVNAPFRTEYLLALAAAFALYLVSVAPGPLWQDSGMAQVRVLQHDLYGQHGLALSHPLYYLLAFAYQYLPFGSPALKTNLVSATFGAVTVANVFLLLRLMTGRWAAAVGTVSLAVAHTFWQHCALAEVYTVSTALMTLELVCVVNYVHTGRFSWLAALFLVNGLGVSNHLFALLSLAVYIAFTLYLLLARQVASRHLPVLALCWLAGASIYLTLVVLVLAAGEPLGQTMRSALFGISYARNVLNVTISRRELVNTGTYIALNFPTPAIVLAAAGLWYWRARLSRSAGAVLLALLAVHLVWAIRYNVPDQYTFFIPSIVLIGVWIGIGAQEVLSRRPRLRGVLLAAAVLPAFLYIPLPTVVRTAGWNLGFKRSVPFRDEYDYFLHPWKTGYHGPEQLCASLAVALPPGSVLLADSTTAPPFQYSQLIGAWPSTVRLSPGVVPRTHRIHSLGQADLLTDLRSGKVYVISPFRGYSADWLLNRYAIVPAAGIYRVTGPKSE